MTRQSGLSALAFAATLTPAWADVTPQQVWDDLTAYMNSFGYEVMAEVQSSGTALVASRVMMALPMAAGDPVGEMSLSIEKMTFEDRGDGTVLVTFPATMPIALSVDPDDGGEQVDMVIDYAQRGLQMVVSGAPDAMVYDYSADMLELTLSSLTVDGEPISRDETRVDIMMGPVEGRTEMSRSNGIRVMDQVFALGDLRYDMAFNDPESSEGAVLSGSLQQLYVEGAGEIPETMDLSDPTAVFNAGLRGTGGYSHRGGRMEFSVAESTGATSGTISTTGGEFSVGFSAEAISYLVSSTGLNLSLSGPEIPFPVSAQMDEIGFDFMVPLQASTTPQEAAFGVTLAGFTTAEMLWNIVDPGAVLPRDPVTLSFDLLAKVTPFIGLMDAEALASLDDSGEMPGELNALSLRNLVIEGVGGLITGAGEFTFDNTDLQSFDGLPRPEGELTLEVAGANGLIDKLIDMGLLAEQDAMGARMMLSMFTVPGNAPDTASSNIVINAQGHVLANGQRIK